MAVSTVETSAVSSFTVSKRHPLIGAEVRGIDLSAIREDGRFAKQVLVNANLRLVALCLAIWFVVSYLFGIILVEPLNNIQIGGYKLGFWFAQQGSIYVFVALIFFYANRMGKLDKEHDVHEDDD